MISAGACPGVGPRGPDPPLLQLMVAFIRTYVLNNIDVVITIIYSQ